MSTFEATAILAKLSPDTQKFVGFLSYGNRTRALMTSLAIAKAFADQLQLPSAPVESITQFFKTTLLITVQGKVSSLNELAIIDTNTVMDYIERFYSTRYNILFPGNTIFCANPETIVSDFFGISKSIDHEAFAALKEQPIEVMKVYNGTVQFLKELGE